MTLVRITVLAAALALFGVACGGSSTPSSTGTTPPATTSPSASGGGPATTTLTVRDNVFDPTAFTFSGTQITLKSAGANLHNFSVEGQNVDDDIQPGETETESLELAPGTYTFFCKYHRALGMQGTITVTG
jgi:plastocyanin